MNVVRVILGFVVALALVTTEPRLSAVSRNRPSDSDSVYTLRVEKGKSRAVRFHMVDPRGDSLIEADQLEFILSPQGLVVRPLTAATASSLSGAKVDLASFELFLPTDGSMMHMDAAVAVK